MADEKQTQDNFEEVKKQAAETREALKDAAAALHGLNRSLQDEAYKGMKDIAGKAADFASDVAEVADPLTRGAASRMNEAAQKVTEATGEAMDKAYELASETYDKAFETVSKLANPKAETPEEAEPEANAEESGAR